VPLLRHRWTPAAGAPVLGVGAVVLWALWPTLRGPERGTDVFVIGSGDVAASTEPLERRVREAGFTIRTQTAPDWCVAASSVAARVAEIRPEYVVIGIADVGGCPGEPVGTTLAALHDVRVVVVAEPGDAAVTTRAAAEARGITIADPTRLLGTDAPSIQPCQWWDVSCPTGSVEVRDGEGRLTAAGAERLARVVAAEIV
jgi:hypothetical protein